MTTFKIIYRFCALLTVLMLCGCMMSIVAIQENLRQKDPDWALKEKTAEIQQIRDAANTGDEYATIELAKRCLESPHFCLLEKPVDTLQHFADKGNEIAMYYYASYRLGLNPLGYRMESCFGSSLNTSACTDRQLAISLLKKLTQRGCIYQVKAYQRLEEIYPCTRMPQ